MALNQSSEALRRPQKVLWIAFPVVAVLSLILGYLGLRELSTTMTGVSHHPLDLFYNDLQFFVLGADPLQLGPGPYPVGVEIARFAAPSVTAYAVVEAVRLLLAVELSRIRARRSSGHAIVCGDTPLANALTRRLRADGTGVVEIRMESDEFVTPGEPLRVVGDARDPDVLLDAGLRRATTVYACTDHSAANIAIALAVGRTVSDTGGPLSVYSLVPDPEFCATVQAFFLGHRPSGRVRMDFSDIDHIAARRLFADEPLRPSAGGGPPRMVVAGVDGLAQASVVEAARTWRVRAGAGGGQLSILMLGQGSDRIAGVLHRRYPFLAGACHLETRDGDLLTRIEGGELSEPPDRVLVTHTDEEYALKTAMTAERYWRGRSGPITVRLDGALIGGDKASGFLAGTSGAVRLFGAVSAAGDPGLIRDDLTERLARVIHDRYLLGRRARGDGTQGRAMVPWEELPAQLQQANRSQSEDIGRKLARVGYAIMPRYGLRDEVTFGPAELETMAVMEHDRWCREQQEAGWRYAPVLDVERKLHPGLVSWAELPETMRLRTYDPVRELPAMLGEAGFQIVRA